MEKVVSLRGTPDLKDLPLGIVKPSADALSWLRGVRGEQEAVRRFDKLGAGWTVMHSIPVGEKDSDIDHLAVGPGGVFAINSKRHVDKSVWVAGGRLLVNGHQQDHIRNSAYEAARTAKALAARGIDVPARAVVAISGAKSITIKAPANWKGRPVDVVSMRQLPRLLTRARVLDDHQVARVVDIVSRPETWSTRVRSPAEVEGMLAAYAAIDRGVDRWRMLVMLVVLAGLAALVGLSAALASGALTPFLTD